MPPKAPREQQEQQGEDTELPGRQLVPAHTCSRPQPTPQTKPIGSRNSRTQPSSAQSRHYFGSMERAEAALSALCNTFFFAYLWESLRFMLLAQGRSTGLQHALRHLSWNQLVSQHSGLVQSINLEFNGKNVGIRVLLLLLFFCLFVL